MSEIKHTPWTAVETRVYFANNAGGFDLRNCPDPEDKARICAAAPELLEALMLVEDRFGAHCIDPLPMDLCERVTAAIAKATGSKS